MTPFTFSFRRQTEQVETSLTAGKEFRFDIHEYDTYFTKATPPRLIDLLRIAVAVYFTDRLVRRKQRNQQRYWSRSLVLNVGVLDPEFWSSPAVRDALADVVEFLSDDSWSFGFHQDDRRVAAHFQRGLFEISSDSQVTLASGGLDSAAGLGVGLSNQPSVVRLPVTIWHQPIQRQVVLRQHRILSGRFDSLANPLIIKTALIWVPELKHFRTEPTQRSRAFLFTAAGGVAAAMVGSSSVDVLESGVGAINVPLMAGMVGSRTTRSCHPEFLRRMGNLVSEVCGTSIKFSLPFFSSTKGQVVKELVRHGLEGLARQTVSCVHFPLRESKHKQCGVCPACILRRQSLAVAGIQEPEDTYKFDLFDSSQNANGVSKKHCKYLNALLGQIVQLQSMHNGESLPPRVQRHLFGTGIISEEYSSEQVVGVLQTYRDEWNGFIARAKSRGISWTKLITASDDGMEGATHATA